MRSQYEWSILPPIVHEQQHQQQSSHRPVSSLQTNLEISLQPSKRWPRHRSKPIETQQLLLACTQTLTYLPLYSPLVKRIFGLWAHYTGRFPVDASTHALLDSWTSSEPAPKSSVPPSLSHTILHIFTSELAVGPHLRAHIPREKRLSVQVWCAYPAEIVVFAQLLCPGQRRM